jgi:hypothetical protein
MYSGLTIKEHWKTNEVQEILAISNEGNRLIVFHACSEHGFFMVPRPFTKAGLLIGHYHVLRN